ncbi:sigma 54-interacting transcriptional regulator [Desulfococcaceae bacterium HSG7]|nr:sigma 54-interacting transcriptional regulator [Desulfococcaceae bacterium HSG7]
METLKLFESLFDAIPDIIGIQDCHHRMIRYNAAGYKFLNITHKELEGKKCYELIGRSTPCDICAITECYRTKTTARVEKYVEEMNVWLDVRAYPIFDENDKIVRVIEHFRDITRRKLMEMRLLMLERAVKQSIDGIAVADMEGFNKFVNPAWAKMHGYSVEELMGEHLSRFHPKKQMEDKVAPFIDQVMKNGSHQGESEHTKKDGTVFPTWMMVNLVKDERGNPIGMVGTARDITEQKRVEKELQAHRDNLEKLVNERTSELTASNKQLTQALSKIHDLKDRLEAENINLREEIKLEHNYEEIIGQSDPLKYVLFKIEEVAPTDSTILILGQTGTGKELFARAIHNNSSRKARPLVKVDCTTLPSNLIESELFGHERGAFSGAVQQRKGRFEIADGSTLFLDEIGELAMELQGKLLRVLEYGEFERLGSSKTLRTDVRIIAATNRNLREEVEKGRFREDLWYRLNVYSIKIPSLKDRAEDIPLLVRWFVVKFSRRVGKTIKTIPQKTMQALQNYHWPGNIRELSNVIESAMISSHDTTLRISEMPETPKHGLKNRIASMSEMERDHIMQALEVCHWRIEGKNGAAKLLDLNPGTLRGRMRKYDMKRP